jgi:hypothetical protein
LNERPIFPQQAKRLDVNRHAVMFDAGSRRHVAPAQERARQIDSGQHGG